MADNVTVGNTSGQDNDYVVASDDDGSAQHQYVKMEWGADGTQTKVAAGNAALPIQDGGNTITVDGTVTANLGTVDNGVLDAIQTAVEAIQAAAEAIETAVEGTLTVNASGTAVPVTDNNSTLTVDGTVTANLGAVDNAVLDNIDADLTTIIGHVDGIEGVLATIDADTGNIATSAALLDDTVFVDDADFTDGTSKGLGIMAVAENTPTTVTDGDMGMLGMDPATRALKVNVENAGDIAGTATHSEDAAHQSGDEGVLLLGVRDDTATGTVVSDEGDYSPFIATAEGGMWIEPIHSVPVTIPATPDAVNAPTPFFSADLDESEEDVGGGNPIAVFGYMIANRDDTNWAYVKFYNDTAANITVGSDTPLYTVSVPPGAAANLNLAPACWSFPTALCVAATTGAAANDTGAPGAGDVQCQLWFTFST